MRVLVAEARMSAQDTTPGQESSSAVLIREIRSNPSPAREWLMSCSISGLVKAAHFTRTEASEPSTAQSWKKRRRVAAAVAGNSFCF